ncbi:type II toxin-antitoxin system RelE family toxin [Wolbachia endosymbiont of Rhagoletis indifferens]|uniref:type II toxin-antitoxin system RelE family toxin n=1 Tax=Wolbachia endosymbiont of Rhagoletis indifferens TaxID=3383250 RepID=UPI003AF3B976
MVKERLTVSPEKAGDPLLGEFKGYRRIRTGDYRLIYRISKSERIVMITAIEHREYIYDCHEAATINIRYIFIHPLFY